MVAARTAQRFLCIFWSPYSLMKLIATATATAGEDSHQRTKIRARFLKGPDFPERPGSRGVGCCGGIRSTIANDSRERVLQFSWRLGTGSGLKKGKSIEV